MNLWIIYKKDSSFFTIESSVYEESFCWKYLKIKRNFIKCFARCNKSMVQLQKNSYFLIFAFCGRGKNTLLWSELLKKTSKNIWSEYLVWHCLVFDIQIGKLLNSFAARKLKKTWTGADAINISGLLNPKKLGNFKNWIL